MKFVKRIKIDQKIQIKSPMAEKYQNYDGLIIGYYGIRGKAQICRLLCEYLHLPYIDLLFTPTSWEAFKSTQASKWNYPQIPFLKHKNLIITETYPICLYIIHQANRKDLLGRNIQDQVQVDMFVWETEIMSQVLSLMTSLKNESQEKKVQVFTKFWHENLRERLIKLQKQVTNTFFLNYLTIVDFYIYEIIYFFSLVAPQNLVEFPKLVQIYKRVASISEISCYQNSSKAIKSVCPHQFCEKWKQKCKGMKQAHKCS